ncbi:DUF4097 domain-containing protein [Streptomyces sp. NPDC059009]|uniref:DUF4097 family beta strand repeat-containing protein n=1 Tax=Streptomyces sp. NPDC059009 TaxID=3346694 RepID=UPI0036A19BB9
MSFSETFETPEPISVTLHLEVGGATIVAGKRTDTAVTVRPTEADKDADVRAAERTTVTYSGGQLTVRCPRKGLSFKNPGSVDVVIELPAHSRLNGRTGVGTIVSEGQLDTCRADIGVGDLHMTHIGTARLSLGHGDILVDRIGGDAEISGGGRLRVGAIDGAATVSNSNGETHLGEVTGEIHAKAANGAIVVGRAHAGVEAKTANGSIRVDELSSGSSRLETSTGNIEIGIREGTAAWLDVRSKFGHVRHLLDSTEGPDKAEGSVEVRAHTGVGDITVRRATATTGTATEADIDTDV